MTKPIQAVNRYKIDLRELHFLLFEQFQVGEMLGKAPAEAMVEEVKPAGKSRNVRRVESRLRRV